MHEPSIAAEDLEAWARILPNHSLGSIAPGDPAGVAAPLGTERGIATC